MYEFVGAVGPYIPELTRHALSTAESFDMNSKAHKIKESLNQELSDASTKEKAIVASAILAAVGEQGPFNELIAALTSVAILENTGNPMAAGVIGGLIYAAEQGVFGLATAGAIQSIPKTEAIARDEFNTISAEGANILDRTLLLVGMGTSATIINEHARNENQTFSKDVKLLGKLTLVLSAVDVAVFTAANGFIANSEKVNIDSDSVIDLATNPWTYVAAFGLLKFFKTYNKYHKNSKK